jgi:hypothetical protein
VTQRQLAEVAGSTPARRDAGVRAAVACTSVALALVLVACSVGLLASGTYAAETAWAAAALRGGDAVSLAVVPVTLIAMLAALRGSRAGALVWAGLLGYNVYNFAYYVFGARFNDLFVMHLLVLTLSGWSLVFLLSWVRRGIPPRDRHRIADRWPALLLGGVALVLGGLWIGAVVREAVTGRLPSGSAPVAALHTVYAVDLTFFVSSLVVATVLGWRGTAYGAVATAVMSVSGAAYLVNLSVSTAFQAAAGVDVAAFSPLTAALTVLFAWSAVTTVRRAAH